MKRFHVHVAVENIADNVRFYSTLFGHAPMVHKPDYAKWMLEDPRINFAISQRTLTGKPDINHLGLQADTDAELEEIHTRISDGTAQVMSETGVDCCYAKSDKHWTKDPQGIAWESFRSLDSVQHYYGDDVGAQATGASLLNKSVESACGTGCCQPSATVAAEKKGSGCCA